jgi:hypothetical protein
VSVFGQRLELARRNTLARSIGLFQLQANMDEDEDLAQENATPELTDREINLALETPGNESADTNTTSSASVGSVVARIESILMQIVDALRVGEELTIVHTSRRSSRRFTNAQPEVVHYPGRNLQESVKFGRIMRQLYAAWLTCYSTHFSDYPAVP